MGFDSLIILILLLLNTAIGKYIIFKIIVNIILIYSIGKRIGVINMKNFRQNGPIFFISFLLIISLLRSNHPDYDESAILYKIYFFIVQILYLFTLINSVKLKRANDIYNFLEYIVIYPFAMFCIINIVLYFNGIVFDDAKYFEDLETGKSVILSTLGIEISRVIFPLANGLNALSIVVGSIFTATGALLIIGRRYSVFNILSAISFIVILLMIDSRMAIFSPLLIFTIIIFRKSLQNTIKTIFKITPYLFIIIPMIIFLSLPLLKTFNVTREDESLDSDFIRFVIWGISLDTFSNFSFLHLIGYGEYGHYGSGASKSWENIFTSWGKSKIITAHNAALSLIFDIGYIGFIYFIIFYRSLIKNLMLNIKNGNEVAYIILGFLLYTSIVGASESFIGFYISNCLFYLNIFCFLSFRLSEVGKPIFIKSSVFESSY